MQSFVCKVFLAFCLLRRFAWGASLSRQTLWRFFKHITILPLNIFTVCMFELSYPQVGKVRATSTSTPILILTLGHDRLRASLKLERQLWRLQLGMSTEQFIASIYYFCIRNSKNWTRLGIYLLTRDKWVSGGVKSRRMRKLELGLGTDNCECGKRRFNAGKADPTD